jgi:hypothetical protein
MHRFDIQYSGSTALDLTTSGYIDIANPTQPDHGFGHVAAVTATAEKGETGTLYVIGFTMPRFAPDKPVSDPEFDPVTGWIPALPTLAVIPNADTAAGTITATEIACQDLSLPIGAVWVMPGDLNGDGDVDLDDYGILESCLAGPAPTTVPGGCTQEQFDSADFGGDGDVDLGDFAVFQASFTGSSS